MTRRLVIAGSGEHSRVVAEAAAAAGLEPIGWTGPALAPGVERSGSSPLPRLGTDQELAARLGSLPAPDRPLLVLGFGGPVAARRRVVTAFGPGATWASVVHPSAWVSPSATIAAGAVVLAGAIVNTGATVGEHVIVNSGAIVEHDVVVGDHAHLAPGATVGGGARIGQDAFIGLNAAVRDHVEVGAGATVGMGAAVTGDVEPGTRVGGVPARPLEPGQAHGGEDASGLDG